MRVITDRWINAQEYQKKFPESFQAPNHDELSSLKIGDFVKICNGKERFWVIIEKLDGNQLTGRVDNILVFSCGYSRGDRVSFQKDHIYNIFK